LPTGLMEETWRQTPRRPNPDPKRAMFGPVVPPPPQLHIKTYVTDEQERLNGSNTYHPRVPANAPAGQFWAVDVYDAETGAFIREPPVA
jgi:Protein of unknown function (DUF1214)